MTNVAPEGTDAGRFTPETAFSAQAPEPNGATIWCVGPADIDRVAEAASILLFCTVEGRRLYRKVRVLMPPGGPGIAELHAAGETVLRARIDAGSANNAVAAFREQVEALEAATLDVADVIAALPGTGERNIAMIIPHAARYRGVAVTGPSERIWAANVAELARQACAAARLNEGFVLIDTGQGMVEDFEATRMLLEADDDCSVMSGILQDNPEVALRALAHRIEALTAERRFGEALALVDTLPHGPAARAASKAAIYLEAGMIGPAAEELRLAREGGVPPTGDAALQVARLAHRAQQSALAAEFLTQAIDRAETLEVLEGALELADQLDHEVLASQAVARLAELFPRSVALMDHRLAAARREGDLQAAANHLDAAGQQAHAAFYRDLVGRIDRARPDYERVLAATAETDPARLGDALRACVVDAGRQGFRLQAARLLLDHLADVPGGGLGWLIGATRELLLADYSVDPNAVLGVLAETTELALVRLGEVPSSTSLRGEIGNLLSTEESGLMGRVVLRNALVRRARVAPDTSLAEPVRPPFTEQEADAFQVAGEAWISAETALLIGQSRCPENLVPVSFHGGLLWELVSTIETHGRLLGPPEEDEGFLRYVGIVCGFASYVEGPDQDLDIAALKLAASQLARAGRLQQARDLIETALRAAGTSPRRRRLAWSAYGEVHRLAGDPYEAAQAFSAALSVEVPITLTEAWHETLDLARVFRDLAEPGIARGMIDRGDGILGALQRTADYGARLDTLRLQVDQMELLRQSPPNAEALRRLLVSAVANGRAVLEVEDEPGPIAAILSQMLRLGRQRGVELPQDADAVAAALMDKMAPGAVARLGRFLDDPTVATLAEQASELAGVRYGRNLVQDISQLVALTRRYLALEPLDAQGAAYAVQLLADHGLLERDEFGLETPASLPTSPDLVLATATSISTTGLGVTLLGLDENGRLVRIDVVDGEVRPPVREAAALFSEDRLIVWREAFPAAYAHLDDTRPDGSRPDAFEVIRAFDESMAGLAVTDLPPQRVIVVPDARLSDLPVNLLSVDGVFAGERRAMAAAPSLTWLAAAASQRDRPVGPSHCWIPTVGAAEDSLLPRVANDLTALLAREGIGLTRDAAMPPDLVNAELAIIGAHGGLGALEERFFRGLSDEVGQVMAANRLAHGLAGAKVAILFVCSGARIDLEPGAQAGLGLARHLLDRGCSAVIGSPWSLGGDVPAMWLPAFLEAWNQGMPVIDANAYANETTRGLASARHALHVYGDPLVCRPVTRPPR